MNIFHRMSEYWLLRGRDRSSWLSLFEEQFLSPTDNQKEEHEQATTSP